MDNELRETLSTIKSFEKVITNLELVSAKLEGYSNSLENTEIKYEDVLIKLLDEISSKAIEEGSIQLVL